MKRIKIIESFQGSGLARIQEIAWERLIQLENGYFEKNGNEYNFYTNDGLLTKAFRNFDSAPAIHLKAKDNLLFVERSETGIGHSLIEESLINPNSFLFMGNGLYRNLGNYFYIKLEIVETNDTTNIPDIWFFHIRFDITDIERVRFFFLKSIFEKPKDGDLLFKINYETNEIFLILRAKYYRKLNKQMTNAYREDYFKNDNVWHSIYVSLMGPKITKEAENYENFY